MALSIDIMRGSGLSTKCVTSCQRRLRKAILAADVAAKGIMHTFYYSNKTEHFSFKSGCVVQVVKHLKEGRFIALR